MSIKTIIVIFFISFFIMSCSLGRKTKTISVLVKVEHSDGSWMRYSYDDKRKEVFEQKSISEGRRFSAYSEPDPRLNPQHFPEPNPRPQALGYTQYDSYKGPEFPRPSIMLPEATIMKYNKFGKLEKEEWDTDGDHVVDIYYLYQYNKDNNLIKIQEFYSNKNEPFTRVLREYGKNGIIKKDTYYFAKDGFSAGYYNDKGQLVKTNTKYPDSSADDSYTLCYYESDLLIKKVMHWNGIDFIAQFIYDKNDHIILHTDRGTTHKYKYDKNGNLIRKAEIDDSPMVTYYHYDKGLLVKEETDFENDGTINIITKYYYDKNGNMIRDEWTYNDGKIQRWSEYMYETINLQ